MDWMPHAIRDGILAVLFVSGPIVVLAATLGLAIGIVQAATQIQEQTLGSAIKIIGVFLALIIGGVWMFSYLNKFASTTFNKAFRLVPSLTAHPLPPLMRFRDGGNSIKTKEPDFKENIPYDFIPPNQEMANFNRAPSGRAANITNDLKEPVIEPVNVGRTTNISPESTIPPREIPIEISGQELQPITYAPVIPQRTVIPEDARPANQAAPTPVQEETPTTRPAPVTTTPTRPAPVAATPTRPAPVASAPTRPAPVTTAPTRPAPAVAPTEAPAVLPAAKKLPRTNIGNITDRIQKSIDETVE